MKKPLVGVVMGSNSDWKVMQHAVDVLKDFGVPYETKVVSAHRTPDTLYRYAESAVPRGLRCVIAGAGGAAHLPVMFAAKTTLPVLCVPVTTRALHGIDSLLSIVQIPKGVPVKSERRRFSRSRASATTARARRWCALHAKRWRRGNPCGANRVIEKRVALDTEVSVVLARGIDNAVAIYPVSENTHAHGILDLSVVPVRISAPRACAAQAAARRIAERLDNVGALAVEFFIAIGKLMVNEIAPRPHNSGHYTLDACVTSQFEQQVRALCGLPLGDTRPLSPVAMVNLPGDLWANGAPRWERVLGSPRTKLHLYGKQEARPGHKMGHYTCLASTPAKARSKALALRRSLVRRPAKRK